MRLIPLVVPAQKTSPSSHDSLVRGIRDPHQRSSEIPLKASEIPLNIDCYFDDQMVKAIAFVPVRGIALVPSGEIPHSRRSLYSHQLR
jgi:hypothetical protein